MKYPKIKYNWMTGSELMMHSVPDAEGLGGIVVNAQEAARAPCKCYGNVCFSKGIIGALNESERQQYCPIVESETSPAMTARIQHWDESRDICKAEIDKYPKGQRLMPWLSCMGRELPKHGVDIH